MACKEISSLNGIFSFFEYQEKSFSAELIAQFKYNYAVEIAGVWEKIIRRQKEILNTLRVLSQNAVIVPVPLFSRRERERGFNQSKILAEIFLKIIVEHFPEARWIVDDSCLKRIKQTAQQAKLTKEERQKNIAGAFSAKKFIPGATVAVIDDVFTTGATLEECARVLKQAGAKEVWGITLARSLSLDVTNS